MTDPLRYAPTGVPGLDSVLLGGIRRGNMTLVEGVPGSGKTLLGMQFVYCGATRYEEPGIIVTFESRSEILRRDAAEFGWDFAPLERANRIKLLTTSPRVLEEELRDPGSVLMQTTAEMGAKRIFIDGISLLRPAADGAVGANGANGHAGAGRYREMLHGLFEALRSGELTAVLSHEIGTNHELTLTLEVAEFLADTIIRLERGQLAKNLSRSLVVVKSRGQDFDSASHTLRIEGGNGLHVYRRVQSEVRDLAPQPASMARRSAIGTPVLDSMFGGGLLEGSVTLIVGAAGAGKSLLGYQLLTEGATTLGKRGLLVTLDEHPAQVLRNAELAGIGLREAIDAGTVFLFSDSPLELEPDVHFHKLSRLIEEHGIERVVIDGLTTLENSIHDQRAYREYIHGLIQFTKARGITLFFCYENPELFGLTRFMPQANISSVVDNVVVLSLIELGDELRRGLTVAKARGSAQSLRTREYVIGQGGLQLLEAEEAEPRPFQDFYNLLSRAPTRFGRDAAGRTKAPRRRTPRSRE